jgi:non-ribosomal peptide synthetase component F
LAFRSGRFAEHEAYWRKQWRGAAEGAIRHAELPFARDEADPSQCASAAGEVRLTAADSASIKEFARRVHLTPYIVFRAAMTLVLSVRLARRRIAFWANFANRQPGCEHLVGWCSNTHIINVDVPGSGSALELCQRVSVAIRDAQRYEAMPLAALWQRLGTSLDTHDTRVNFDVSFVPSPPARQKGVEIEVLLSSFLPRLDLDVRLFEDDGRCCLRGIFNPRRYDHDGVAALVRSTANTAVRIASRPQDSVSSYTQSLADIRLDWEPFNRINGASLNQD